MKPPTFRLICFILLITQLPVFNPAQTQPDSTSQRTATKLEQGKPIERKLKDGESHSYEVTLMGGQFAKVLVVQQGIDLSVTLFEPTGNKIIGINNREHGTEQLSILAEINGAYRIELGSNMNSPLTLANSGLYKIMITDLQQATPSDTMRFTTQRLYSETKLPLSSEQKIEKLKEVSNLWKLLGETSLEANTIADIARQYQLNQEYPKVFELFNEALRLWRSVNDRSGEAFSLLAISSAFHINGDFQNALNYLEQALAVYRATGDSWGELNLLYLLSHLYGSMGHLTKSIYYSNLVLVLAEQLGSPKYYVYQRLAYVYSRLGEAEKSREYALQAITEIQAMEIRPDDLRKLSLLSIPSPN